MHFDLHSMKRNKFVLMVGDEGAILTYFRGKTLKQRLFSTLNQQEGLKSFSDLLETDPAAPIYCILDVMDQSCIRQSLPAVSGLTINKLVRRRLERDFSPDDIKGAIPVGRETTGRKDWVFMFISAHLAPPFSAWVHFCMEQRNPLASVHMLPVEAEMLQKKLNHALGIHKNKQKTEWQFLILHNRISGFRQMVFHKGRIVFHRLVGSSPQELPGVVAGNIEQEIINSVEYLRRLSLPEDTKMDVVVCVSDEVKNSFKITKVKGHNLVVFTPQEIANKLGFTQAIQQKDKFCDVAVAANFIQHKPVLTLHTKQTKALALLAVLNTAARYAAIAIIPLALVLMSLQFWKLVDINDEIALSEQKKQEASQRWEALQKTAKTYDAESTMIRDMVVLYKLLSGGTQSPLTVLAAFNQMKGNNVIVKNVSWKLLESTAKGQVVGNSSINMTMSVEYYNEGQSIDQFFASFDDFIKRVEQRFPDYNIQFSQLPEKVTVGETNRVIPVEITLLGPLQQGGQ